MSWMDVTFMAFLFAFAGIILYRAIRKKKWCPTVFGSADKDTGKDTGKDTDK